MGGNSKPDSQTLQYLLSTFVSSYLFSSAGALQQTLYQVPSNRPVCSPVDPKAVAGIYEIEPDANPLHPHHQSHVLQQLHNDDPLHSSLRRGSVPERPLSATIHKYSRVPKTPPPKTRPPECPPADHSFSSRKMRSYSTDELSVSSLQSSASPLAFNPPLKQQNRKSEAMICSVERCVADVFLTVSTRKV